MVQICFLSQMSQSSEYADDHRVRLIEIAEDEEAVIRVRTKFHVSLVFGNCTIELFEKNGVVYTRQEYRAPSETDALSVGEPEYPADLETQPLLDESTEEGDTQLETQPWDYDEPSDPADVVSFANGTFSQVNARHSFSLEDRLETITEEFGQTQLEPGPGYDSDSTTDSVYTSNGIYIPKYLLPHGRALLCPDSQPIEEF